MSWKTSAARYRCQPRRLTFTESDEPGRVVANFLFHRYEPNTDPVDFPASVEIYEKHQEALQSNPEIVVVCRKGKLIALTAGGQYTPNWKKLHWTERVKYFIPLLLAK